MKKIVSLFLLVTLLVSLVPTGVSAYNENIDSEWIANEFQSVFSEKIGRRHPHEGYYYTNSGEKIYLEFAYNPRCSECIENLCHEYDAHSCLSEYRERDDYVHFSCFCGKTIKVAYTKLEKFFDDRRQDTEEICRDINYDLADASVYDDTLDSVIYDENEESTLTGNFDLPKTLSEGTVYKIVGEVNSNYLVDLIDVYVSDYTGTIVQQSQIHPNSFNVVISESSKINDDLNFSKLKSGTYTLYIDLSDVSGATGNASAVFEIIKNEVIVESISALEISLSRAPVTIAENYFGLRGSVTSNYIISDVWGYVVDAYGNTILSSYDSPNSTYMDIRTANLNNHLNFGKLNNNANYTLVVVAKDVSGKEVYLEQEFSVKRPTYNSASNNGDSNVERLIVNYLDFSPAFYEIVKDEAPLRKTPYNDGVILAKIKKGTVLRLTGKCYNESGNIWYVMEVDGEKGYIYAGNIEKYIASDGRTKWQIFLDDTSNILTSFSIVPYVDTVADAAATIVDLLRGDLASAGLSAMGIIPVLGEGADAKKTANLIDNAADVVKTAGNLSKREQLLKLVTNPKLKNTVNDLYRPGAVIGDGGTADSIRHYLKTGELVSGSTHIQKGEERVRNLKNILETQDLNTTDRKIAYELLQDLIAALEEN